MNEESLFAAALEKPTRAERRDFLNEACANDEALRRRVERLLQADEQSGGLLHDIERIGETPPHSADAFPPNDEAGLAIGPYKLKEKIGEGGFGLVYVAEQQHPVRRKVALKIIKPGLETREVIARFEAERQALAMMDHPHIARVFDAGVSDSGRPYFVMELVRGIPITDYCDHHQFTTRERLELFISVCQAVQHAHQKGIIHRDIKPSNVLVTRHDDKSVVKVIDFGVAKALNHQLTEHSVYTRFALIVGTPLYMSPEQAEISGLDVDTRADIYSLGVLLYELLTGTTPFDRERLKSVGFDELRRIIREEDPPRPSTRLSTLGQAATTVFANRRSDLRHLGRSIRGELDWIVMKALEKDRTRRYDTAADLARDVQHYLRDEPVEASPPSRAYRLRKFLRRNRGPVLAASFISLALVGGIVGTTWGMIRAEAARDAETRRAESETRERLRAEAAEAEAKSNEREARSTTHLASEMVMFLQRDMLGTAVGRAEPFERFPPNPNLTVREALDRAAASVGERFKGQRHIEAGIRMTIGDAYRRLGEYEKAVIHLRRAAELRRQYRGADHLETLAALHNLAEAENDAGRPAEAIKLYEQVREGQVKELGPEHDQTLTTLSNLAIAYRDDRRTTEALALFKHILAVRTKTLGPDDPRILTTRHNIATMALDAGDTAEGIAQLEQIRDARDRVNGPEHPKNLPTLNNLAVAYWKTKQLEKSIPVFERLVKLNQKYWGETHLDTVSAMANLGVNYRDAGRLDEAIPRLRQAYEQARAQPRQHWIGGELLIAYARAGKAEEVKSLATEFHARARKTLPAASPQLADALARGGYALVDVKAWAEAESVLRECLAIRAKKSPDDWRTFNTQSMLGRALLAEGRFADAEPLLLAGYRGMKERAGKMPSDKHVHLTNAVKRLVQLYDDWGKPAEAAGWRLELDSAARPGPGLGSEFRVPDLTPAGGKNF